jgi:hypothetical protein
VIKDSRKKFQEKFTLVPAATLTESGENLPLVTADPVADKVSDEPDSAGTVHRISLEPTEVTSHDSPPIETLTIIYFLGIN